MPLRNKVILGAISALATYRVVTYPLRRSYISIARTLLIYAHDNDELRQQMEYLVSLLNENDITLDEFDLIVLHDIVKLEQ